MTTPFGGPARSAPGLPNLPTALTEAKSYAERLFAYRSIGPLDRQAATAALVRPAAALDVEWSAPALDLVLDRTQGFPYFVQAFGREIWDYAAGSPAAAAGSFTSILSGVKFSQSLKCPPPPCNKYNTGYAALFFA